MHICINTYQSPSFCWHREDLCAVLEPLSFKALENFLMVPVTLIVVPTSFFNDLPTNSFFTNAIRLLIPAAPNVLTKLVSNVNRTDKLKMYIFKYIFDEFGVRKELIRYILETI